MNRRNFLQKLGLVSVGAIVAPFILSDLKKDQSKYILGCDCCDSGYTDLHQFVIVRRYDNNTVYMDGKINPNDQFLIDEMAIWKRKLTDNEVKTIFDNIVNLKENQYINFWA